VAWLDEINWPSETNILLLVDQFEEIFRYRQGQSGDDIDAFVALLVASAKFSARNRDRRRIYVVITMRSDFLGDCSRFTDLAETINDGQFLTPRLTREQCQEAIEGPAAVYGGKVEPALVTRMLNDMGGNPDQLPLMQHILMLLWEKGKARDPEAPELTLADYKRLGGIGSGSADADATTAQARRPSLLRRLFGNRAARNASDDASARSGHGALSDHADRVLAELTPEQQRLAAILLRALTQGEGEGGRDVRRPISLAKAAAIAEVPPAELIPIIKAFAAPGRNFLTPADPDATAPDKTIIDISHESLIRQWVRLRQWVREEYQSAETYRYIERSAKQWKLGLGNLLMKVDLAVARRWRKDDRPNAAWAERYGDSFDFAMRFLRKSVSHRRWRRGIAAVTAVTVATVILSTTAISLYLSMVMTSGLSYVNPADEWSNFGVNPQTEMKRDVGTNTPLSIPGGRVIGTGELESAINRGTLDGSPFLSIDALRRSGSGTPTLVVPGSIYIGYAGDYGTFEDTIQQRLREELAGLTKGNLDMPLVFFCAGARCWESYNAALRAMKLGYTKVYWYRGGIESWRAAHRPYPIDFARIPLSWSGAAITARTLRQAIWPDPDYYFKRGLDYLDNRQLDSAIADFTEAIERNPKHVEAYYRRAFANMSKGDYGEALTDFFKLMELDPQRSAEIKAIISDPRFAAGYVARGDAYYSKREYDRAIEEYTRAIELNPQYAQGYGGRGLAFYQKNDNNRAIADFGAAIKLDPTNATYFNGRGNAYFSNGSNAEAIRDYSEAIRLSPQTAFYYVNRANTLYRVADYDNAIADYDRGIRLEPSASSYNLRGNTYFAKRDYQRAIRDYDEAIRLDPKFSVAYGNRALAYNSLGQFDRAIQDYGEAIGLDPKSASLFNNRGVAYSNKRDYDRAMKDFEQAIALDPKYVQAYNNRGDTLLYKDDYDGAIRDFQKALELGFDKSAAFENLGKVYFAKYDFNRSAEEYGKALALTPNKADALAGRGRAELYAGRYDAAIADLSAALRSRPGYAYYAIWLHMARLRANLVNLEELAANTEKLDHAKWPWPVIGMFLGASAPDTMHAAARSIGSASDHDDQVCEADFYLGFYRAARGERDEAKRLLQSAVSICPRSFFEFPLARAELARLQ
jgi:PQQ-dependent catabolism-associated CXXCW motif protein